jgi:hypothetical protein
MQDHPLDQHQADEGFAETDAIAQEGSAVLAGNLQESPIRFLLVAIELRK